MSDTAVLTGAEETGQAAAAAQPVSLGELLSETQEGGWPS